MGSPFALAPVALLPPAPLVFWSPEKGIPEYLRGTGVHGTATRDIRADSSLIACLLSWPSWHQTMKRKTA